MKQMSYPELPFNPKVLLWARKRLCLSVPEVAKKAQVKPERIEQWESGKRVPSIIQGRKLAAIYDRPLLEFFATDIPDVPGVELVPDFRFYSEGPSDRERVLLESIQRWAEEQRLNALDLLAELGEQPTALPAGLYATIDTDVETAADRARHLLDVKLEDQFALNVADIRHFTDHLRARFDRVGVLALRQSGLKKLRTRGLCLYAEPMPVIVFGQEAPTAQAFTLSHELGHVLLRCSAISGPIRFGRNVRTLEKRIEGWCNRFAAAFLIPREAVVRQLGSVPERADHFDDHRLRDLANLFSVSRHAMLIRLVNLGYVASSYYWRTKRPQFIREEDEYSSFGRPPYYGTRYVNKLGKMYTGLVLEAWDAGRITSHNAAEFMGIRNLAHLEDIRNNFGA